jgi:hypothetical protein
MGKGADFLPAAFQRDLVEGGADAGDHAGPRCPDEGPGSPEQGPDYGSSHCGQCGRSDVDGIEIDLVLGVV